MRKKIDRKKLIQNYYSCRVNTTSPGYEILSWSNKEAQFLRFQILLDALKKHFPSSARPSLLDVGCGLAELQQFLSDSGFEVDYTGVDITEDILEEAHRRKPGLDLRLIDVFQAPCPFEEQSFDIVYASGIFNMELGNNERFAVNGMTRLCSLAKEMALANFLHIRCSFPQSLCHFYDPTVLIKKLKNKKISVKLQDQYLANDFSLLYLRNQND